MFFWKPNSRSQRPNQMLDLQTKAVGPCPSETLISQMAPENSRRRAYGANDGKSLRCNRVGCVHRVLHSIEKRHEATIVNRSFVRCYDLYRPT